MKKLTDKELKIMDVLWDNGPLSTRDIITHLPDITTHFNTIATYVRRLEHHGMIGHEELSPRFYLYHATVTREQYMFLTASRCFSFLLFRKLLAKIMSTIAE